MKKKISKKFLILSISLVLITVSVIIFACAGGDDFADFYKSFFAPETAMNEDAQPYFRSVHIFYGFETIENNVHIMDFTNLAEWKSFLQGKVTEDDLYYMVYQSRIGEIDTCIFFLKNNKYPIKNYLKKNSLLAYPDKNLVIEILYYLGYAKRCEPYATYFKEYWWEDDESKNPRNDHESMQRLLTGGKKAICNVKSSFVKERYTFQIIRLMNYMGLHQECVDYYDSCISQFTNENSILYRTMGYAAASFKKLENYTKANYLYSLIYDRCPEMKKISYLSFAPQYDEDWVGSLDLAKNNREKEVLWQLLGITEDPLRAMKEIYQLDPRTDLLDLLIVRAININEESFLPDLTVVEGSSYALSAESVDDELLSFTQKAADAGNTNKTYLWHLATGYLKLAKGDYKSAGKYLSKAETTAPDSELIKDQINTFRIVSKIEQYEKANAKQEAELAKDLKWLEESQYKSALRTTDVYQWALKRLSEKYLSWGDLVKAQCLNPRHDRAFYDNESNMTALIAYIDKEDKSSFDEFLIYIHPYSSSDLFTYRAIKLIYQYKFKEAAALFDASDGSGSNGLNADPFIIHINDCHDCDFEIPYHDGYDQVSFVKRILELQDSAVSDPKNASEYYFLIANGLYNMTYFGNSRAIYYSPLIELGNVDFDYDYNVVEGNPLFDCSEALRYYNMAREASKDKEFQAKCTFMAAKCEQNQYFCSSEFNNDNPVRSGVNFQILKDNYSKTNYYKEIIRECGYFSKYIGIKK